MKTNLENKHDLGRSRPTLRQITYMPYTNFNRSAANTTYRCVPFVDYDNAFDSA